MVDLKNIILKTPVETLERLLSPFIEEQFPSFMRRDYRKLVLFIKAYYEWTEQQGNPGFVMSRLDTIYDIDRSLDEFYSHFKATYLDGFPESFATNTSGNRPNKNTLLKHIRDFYGNKGTENAYKFLFRVLYDSDIEFYYPKEDILKTSDGRWIENISIKTTSVNGSTLFNAKGTSVYQYIGTALVASADIDNVVQYNQNGYDITEFFLKNLIGNFVNSNPVTFVINGQSYTENLYSVLSDFFIQTPGRNFRVGDEVFITDTKGTGFSAFIEQTGLGGTIKKIGIKNSGINYFNTVTVSFISETGDLSSAVVLASPTAVTRYPGFYTTNSGKLSSTKKIQDGNYYQDFSYVLKTAVSLDTYFGVLKELVHPAGTRMFGSILVKDALNNIANTSTQGVVFRDPIVGNYTPYALRTFTNLRNSTFLPNQVRGATLQVWLSAYNITGITTDGVTVGWQKIVNDATIGPDPGGTLATTEDILGINHWQSLVTGYTFSQSNLYPNSNVWLTPELKPYSLNTHTTVNIRPLQYNFSGPSYLFAAVSHGFFGPSGGRMGLTASKSYFAVVKPNRISLIETVNSTSARVILGDTGSYHGIVFGLSGTDLTDPKVFAFTNSVANGIIGVCGSIGSTGEWKLLSHTHSVGGGNSGPFSLFLDGVCLGTQSQAWVPEADLSNANITVGVRRIDSLNDVFDGEIAEVVMYQGDVGTVDRQKIEGYLAHKYGLAANLPSTHPYKTTPPGGSYGSGKWYGNTGDFYPSGYNPYIGSTAEVGIDGTTAPLGSGFFYTQLGYTYTVCDEFGVTAHNPIGAPLGSTAAWFRGRETNLSPEGMRGLVLWLKPENIGVCGSVANGVSVDVWRDASPSGNDAMPPTWDKWNGILTTTYNSSPSGGWNEQVYTTNPITKLRFVFNGVCGGFTTGRLFMVGLNSDPSTNSSFSSIDYALYNYGPYAAGAVLNNSRAIYYYQGGVGTGTLQSSGTNYSAFDNSVFEIEYKEPNIVYSMDGVVKRTVYSGYGKTYYMDSSFYGDSGYPTQNGHSLTILGMWNGDTPVTPTAATTTTTSGLTTVIYAGVTVDKLRPTLQTASASGATGVSFNGGLVFSPQTTYRGVSLAAGICMGFTAAGSSAEKLMTGQHMYLKRPLKITDDADIFVVYRTTIEGLSYGYGLLASRNTNVAYGNNLRLDSVLFNRSYNAEDRNPSLQNSSYYTILPNGTVLYPGSSLPPAGLVGFRPQGDAVGAAQNFIVYDPHLSGVCMGTCIGEARRDSNNKIESFLNGDIATNSSPVTGRRIVSVSPPPTDNFIITKNLLFNFDAGKTASLGEYITAKNINLLDAYPLTETPMNVLAPQSPSMWRRDNGTDPNPPDTLIRVTQDGTAPLGRDEVYEFTAGANGNVYLSYSTHPSAWSNPSLIANTWTFTLCVRRDDGAAITAASVYIYGLGSNDQAAGTVEDIGDGWYRITRTKTGTTATTVNLVGITGLVVGTKYRIGRAMLLPYPSTSDISGVGRRESVSYPTGYARVGTITANEVGYRVGPWGKSQIVWEGVNHSTISTSATFNGNGGFATPSVPIDRTKLYRFSVWVNRAVLGSGDVYFGNGETLIKRSDGTSDTTPYFTRNGAGVGPYDGKQNKWVLVVGHIHPAGSAAGANHPNSGFYEVGSGFTYAGLASGYSDKIWTSTSTTGSLGIFLYGSNTEGSKVWFTQPRIEVVDGNEVSIEDLTNNTPNTLYDLSPTGNICEAFDSPAYSSDGGGSMVFNAKGGLITSKTGLALGDSGNSTWEAWIKPAYDTFPGAKNNYMFMGGGTLPYFIAPSGTKQITWVPLIGGANYVINSPVNSISAGTWVHMVCVAEYDGVDTTAKMYINGQLVTTAKYSGKQTYTTQEGGGSTTPFITIGDRKPALNREDYPGIRSFAGEGFNWQYEGSVSCVRVYARALNDGEIRQNFNSLRNRFGV